MSCKSTIKNLQITRRNLIFRWANIHMLVYSYSVVCDKKIHGLVAWNVNNPSYSPHLSDW